MSRWKSIVSRYRVSEDPANPAPDRIAGAAARPVAAPAARPGKFQAGDHGGTGSGGARSQFAAGAGGTGPRGSQRQGAQRIISRPLFWSSRRPVDAVATVLESTSQPGNCRA